MQALQETFEEEQRLKYADRVRPEEDEELVGREAAERARRERMGWGRGVLEREERRWDWMLGTFPLFLTVFRLCWRNYAWRNGGFGEQDED
jgi:hypothetical protein